MVRPTFEYKKSLKLPRKADYEKMLQICIEALLNRQEEVMLVVSHLTKFPADFPKGLLDHKDHPNVFRRVKTKRLLAWLRKRGITDITPDSLGVEVRKFTILEKELVDYGFVQ